MVCLKYAKVSVGYHEHSFFNASGSDGETVQISNSSHT